MHDVCTKARNFEQENSKNGRMKIEQREKGVSQKITGNLSPSLEKQIRLLGNISVVKF